MKLLKYLFRYKWMVLGVIALIFGRAMTELFLPTLMGNIVDNGIVEGDMTYIWKVGGVMLLVTAIGVGVAIAGSYYSSKIAMGVGRDIRRSVFKHVSRFSLQEFDEVGTASLITRNTNDITQVQQALMMMLRLVIMAPIMFAGGLIMAIVKDPLLSLVVIGTMPVLIGVILIVLRKGMPLFRAVQERLDRLSLVMRENLTGIRVIRAFNREEDEQDRLETANTDLTNVSIKVNKLMAFLMPGMMLLMNITIVTAIWFGGIRINSGNMPIGDLMAFIQYVMLILFALVMASMMFIILPRASVSAHRINTVLEMEPVLRDDGTEKPNKQTGMLEFNHVTFTYPGSEYPAIKDIHFTANPGEITAIIGGTGSGKTTLVNLIPRFYEATSGTIKVNNVDITQAPLTDIRAKIGLVPQQATLFSGTIADNIRYGKEEATKAEIKHAAQIAQADDFIESLDDGYDSIVEQGGTNFSGGQKQRLSIARALVRKPDIYLFDDSFSALDYKTDAKLREALKQETEQSTVLIVAQRVSTVMDADQIIVLDNGEMAGIGTHDQLLESNQVYQEIVKSQFGEDETA